MIDQAVIEPAAPAASDMAWLQEPTARGLFMRFPMPLAMVGEGGRIELFNEQYAARYDAAALGAHEARAVADAADGGWHAVRLSRLGGGSSEVAMQGTRVRDAVMVIIDETPGAEQPGEIARLHARIDELEKLRGTDHLTGAWNRAQLDRVVEVEIGRSRRFRQPLSLVLLDIDHFKRINDTFGHQAGDSVLREVVKVVGAAIRTSDTLFRWGGEEFVVLAPGTGYRNAEALAEALRKRIEAHDFPPVGRVTVSLGVAEHVGAEAADTWFSRVDRALYAAKEGGRNRTVVERRGDSDAWTANGAGALHLVWQEAYECGEPTIDGEHRALFDLANAALDAAQGGDRDAGMAAVDRLLAHVRTHFSHEEAILQKHGYARLEQHKTAHAGLLRRAAALRERIADKGPELGALVEFVAEDVVARHLFTADRDFYPLFAQQGAAAQ